MSDPLGFEREIGPIVGLEVAREIAEHAEDLESFIRSLDAAILVMKRTATERLLKAQKELENG